MQAGKEPGQVNPEQCDDDGGHAGNRPEAVNSLVIFAEHVAEVEIPEENKPRHQRPEFFRVPAPVVAPCEFAPIAAEEKAECKQGKADANYPIRRLFGRQQIFTGLGIPAGQLAKRLIGGFCHKDV